MRVTTTRGLAVAVGLLVVALLVDAAATLYNIRDVATSVEWVAHTHEVLAKVEAALSTLKDAETGQRGYLLTGERAYLEPYRDAVGRFPGQMTGLAQLTLDNPTQTARGSSSSRVSACPSSGAASTSSRPSPTGPARYSPRGRWC